MYKNNLSETDKKIIQPANLNIELMEHQKTNIQGMIDIENDNHIFVENLIYFTGKPTNYKIRTSVGILGEKVGSGKSLMIVSLILLNKLPPEHEIYYESSKYISIMKSHILTSTNISKKIKSNLLIVPQKILDQWINFFKFAPTLKIYTCKDLEAINSLTPESINNYDVCIVPCVKHSIFNNKFSEYKWSRIIIDEADTIKLAKDIDLDCDFLWLVTGTPSGILYSNKSYIKNIFSKNKNWILDYITIKTNKNYLNASMVLPIPKRFYIKCKTPSELNIIKDLIPKNVINLINSGNTDEAIKTLNCKEDTTDNIIKVITHGLTNSINNKNIELAAELKKKYHGTSEEEQQKKIKKIKLCIERLTTRLETVKKRIYDLNNEYCPICIDSFTRPVVTSCCKNIFCFECITLSIANTKTCPNCKNKIEASDFNLINDNKSNNNNNKESTNIVKEKMDTLLELVLSKKNGKFLVFANYHETFLKIEKEFKLNNIIYRILKGNNETITQNIKEFDEGKIQVLLLNVQNYGAGMNLQMATDIIIYHRFTAEIEEQVIGRAQRIGRKTSLLIYYLLHNNEDSKVNSNDNFEDCNYDYMTFLENIK